MKANERIYIHDWLAMKPYQHQTKTDSYYLRLSNEVKQTILSEQTALVFLMYIHKEDIDLLSCFLCAWFEDMISQTNVYGSFVRIHKRLYNKQLPFYDLDEYYEDEINPQDVSFLIWYFLNTIQTEKFIAPFNGFITKTAEKVFAVFDNAWDNAPENRLLKSIYTSNEDDTDFYSARYLIDTILFKTYLFFPDTLLRLKEQEEEIVEDGGDNKNLLAILNENRDSSLHKSHTRLLSLQGKEWAAEVIGTDHPLYPDFLNSSQRIRGYFIYKGQDEFNISLEHISSGKKFKLCKKSFDHSSNLKEVDTIVFMGIVKWRDEWWFSGVYFQTEFNADLVLDEKNSLESRRAVDFLDHKSKETEETIELQQRVFLDYNHGAPIAFMASEEMENYMKEFTLFYNKSLTHSEKDFEEARERARKEGYFGKNEDESHDFSEIAESGLLFFNPKSGIEMAFDVNSAFPLPDNSYFKEEESEDHIFRLLMDESISSELAMYCINNCKTNLPFFENEEGKRYLNDIDFLLRFWKKENYHSKPSVTLVGTAEK
ncbi:MAG: DUF3843 family protein [Bacteroidia bacterium]|nr:DUF3843 family protein [Bacteroidia bacterium]